MLLCFLSFCLFCFVPLHSCLSIHTSSHPWLSSVASLSASCQSPCSLVSESMTAHQILQPSSFGEQSHPMRAAAGASGFTPASVCFPLRSGIWAALRHEPQATTECSNSDPWLLFFLLLFFFFFLLKPLDTSSQISSAINALRFNWIRPHVSHTHS